MTGTDRKQLKMFRNVLLVPLVDGSGTLPEPSTQALPKEVETLMKISRLPILAASLERIICPLFVV